jgi:hypothetical protein
MVALRGKSQHELQHEFLVELRGLLNLDLSNHTNASFENERILNQSHVAYNGVSMQRGDENEKNEINQTLPAAVFQRNHITQADVSLPTGLQSRSSPLSIRRRLVGSTPARAEIPDRHRLLLLLLLLGQALLSDNLSVRSLSGHVDFEFASSGCHDSPVDSIGSRLRILSGREIDEAVVMITRQCSCGLVW